MSTPTATALRPAPGLRIAWLPVVLVFVVGITIGAVGSASLIAQSRTDSGGGVVTEPTAANTELTRLLGNLEAAAQRGDVRLFIEFREDLAALIRSAGMAEYQALRSVASPGE
jgi:hypothetical protein